MKLSTSFWAQLLFANPPPQQQILISCRKMHRPFFGGRVLVGVAFALVVLLSNSAQAALVHYWDFEEPDGTAAPQVKDLPGTRDGNFGGLLSDANRSADVPTGINSTRSLDFGTPNPSVLNGAGNYVDVYTPSGSYLEMGN